MRPPFAVNLGDAVKMNGCLVIPARVELGNCQEVSRYRLLAKIQLTAPGRCRHLGLLRNFIASTLVFSAISMYGFID